MEARAVATGDKILRFCSSVSSESVRAGCKTRRSLEMEIGEEIKASLEKSSEN